MQLALQKPEPLFHMMQSESLLHIRTTLAVVRDPHCKDPLVFGYMDLYPVCLSVTDRIGYTFLHNAVDILKAYFAEMNIDLIDFKVEFGRYKGEVILADEISPDTCRFWDSTTHEKLDKDRFRRDLGHVEEAYEEMFRRLGL